MDIKAASEKIRALAKSVATEGIEQVDKDQGTTVERLTINALQVAWADAIRDQWNGFCEANPELKAQVAVARELMADAAYPDGDPVCGPPCVEAFIAMVDGKKAVCYDYSMVNAMPLSAIFANRVSEVMNAAAKVSAKVAAAKEAEKK